MSRTAALSRDIASALAERLDEVAPAGVTVRANGRDIEVLVDGQLVGHVGAAVILDEDGEGLPEERVGTVAAAVLGGVQDEITQALTEPWPVHDGRMALPDARQTGNRVEAWFGDETSPVLQLRPITVPGWM